MSAIFNCIFIPIKIAYAPVFLESTTIFILNLIIDLLFFIDILITFRTGYIDDTGNEVLEPRLIGIEYVKG